MRTLITLITFILAGFLLVYWDSKSSENKEIRQRKDFLILTANSRGLFDDYDGESEFGFYSGAYYNFYAYRQFHLDKITIYKDELKEAVFTNDPEKERGFVGAGKERREIIRIRTNIIYYVSESGSEGILAFITNMNVKTTDNKKQEKSAGKKPNWEKIYSIDITKSDSYMTRKEYKEYIKQLKTMGVYKKSEDKGYKAYLEELKQSMINSALKRDWLSNFKNKTHSGTSRGTIYKVGNGGDWIYLQKTWEPNDNYDLDEVFDPQSKAIYSFRDNNDFLNIKGYVGMTIQNDIIYKSKEVFSSKEEVYTYFNSIKDYENNSDCERIIKLVPMTEDIMIDRLSEGFFY